MITLTLLIWSFLIHVIEAAIEAEHGDRRHWPSLAVTVLFYSVPLLCYGLPLKYLFLYPAIRVWFDLIYNYFKGNWWYYLGGTSWTDRKLIKYNSYLILMWRVIASIIFITLTL